MLNQNSIICKLWHNYIYNKHNNSNNTVDDDTYIYIERERHIHTLLRILFNYFEEKHSLLFDLYGI